MNVHLAVKLYDTTKRLNNIGLDWKQEGEFFVVYNNVNDEPLCSVQSLVELEAFLEGYLVGKSEFKTVIACNTEKHVCNCKKHYLESQG